MDTNTALFYVFSAVLLLAVGDRYEAQIAKDREQDAKFR